jgi:hypothetical protein
MKVKVIHIDKNGVETNFGEHDLSELPSAGDLIEIYPGKIWIVVKVNEPVDGTTPTIVVKDV